MKHFRYTLLSTFALAALDPDAGCNACPGTPTPPPVTQYSVPAAEADALLVADDNMVAAADVTAEKLTHLHAEGVVHRDVAARFVFIKATTRFVHEQAHTLAVSRGAMSNEQIVSTLVMAATVLEGQLQAAEGEAQGLGDDFIRMLTSQREMTGKARNALVAVFDAATAHTAAHEAAHVVQQKAGVSLRTSIAPTRVWVEAGKTLTLDATCSVDTELRLVSLASGEMMPLVVKKGEPGQVKSTAQSRTSFAVLLHGEKGKCDLTLTAPVDLHSAPTVPADTAALVKAIADQRAVDILLAEWALNSANFALLADVATVTDNMMGELASALDEGRAFPVEDVKMAALAQGAWIDALLTDFAGWTNEPEVQQNIHKSSHDMQMAAIRNLK